MYNAWATELCEVVFSSEAKVQILWVSILDLFAVVEKTVGQDVSWLREMLDSP